MTNQKNEPISVNKQAINWGVYSGVAMGVQKYTKTHVSGGYGDVPAFSRSETIVELSIRKDSGKESEMTLKDVKMRVRDGQRVSGIWGYTENESSYWLVFVNHDIDDWCWLITPVEFFESLKLFVFLSGWWIMLFLAILIISTLPFIFPYVDLSRVMIDVHLSWVLVGMITGTAGTIFCVIHYIVQRYRVKSAWNTIMPQLIEIVRQSKY